MNSKKLQVFHVWNDYTSSLFDQTHSAFLKMPEMDSVLLVGKLLQNEAQVLPETHFYSKRSVDDIIAANLLLRVVSRVKRFFFDSRFISFCDSLIRSKRSPLLPSLIHSHFGTTGAILSPLVKKSKLPALVSFYGVDASTALKDLRWKVRFSEMFQTYDTFVVLCEEVKRRLVRFGCEESRIRVWNLPAGVESYPLRVRNRAPDEPLRFISAARFVEKKGLDVLLNAFQKVLKTLPDAELTLIGYGPQKEKLEALARELKIESKVRFLDTRLRPDFKEVYYSELKNHDVFVLPSIVAKNGDDEGGPALTLVCAQAAGLPVICTPFPGAEISVIENETGYYCESDSSESLATVMLQVGSDSSRWNEVGARASKRVHEEFSLSSQIQKLLAIYQETIRAHASKN